MILTRRMGRCSMIVPLSVTFSRDFRALRSRLCDWGASWFSSYDNIPAALFTGVSQRCTIWVGNHRAAGISVAPMYRWRSAHRPYLMGNLAYASTEVFDTASFGLPKLADASQATILQNLSAPVLVKHRICRTRQCWDYQAQLRFSQTARNFVSVFREFSSPCLDATTLREVGASKVGALGLATDEDAYAALASTIWRALLLVLACSWGRISMSLAGWLETTVPMTVGLRFLPNNMVFSLKLGRILDAERNRWLVRSRRTLTPICRQLQLSKSQLYHKTCRSSDTNWGVENSR